MTTNNEEKTIDGRVVMLAPNQAVLVMSAGTARLVGGYMTLTTNADPPDTEEGYVPPQTVWLSQKDTFLLMNFLNAYVKKL